VSKYGAGGFVCVFVPFKVGEEAARVGEDTIGGVGRFNVMYGGLGVLVYSFQVVG
jgi:hypothetical protein